MQENSKYLNSTAKVEFCEILCQFDNNKFENKIHQKNYTKNLLNYNKAKYIPLICKVTQQDSDLNN